MVIKSQGYKVRVLNDVSDRISPLPERQQSILRALIRELEEKPDKKGRPIRGERNRRVISNGGYRAVYRHNASRKEVEIEAVTAPLASVIGEAMSVWDLPRFRKMREQPVGTPIELTREEALAIAMEAFASKPELPSGVDYVRRFRPIWRGLLKKRDG